tara:strand:+ start:160 stop:693 length:534 start_codon:yes stop_codon:yes gene_type:complete
MKKLLFSLVVSSVFVSCTQDLGNLSSISTEEIKMNQKYELALKQQTYTANSLEACVDLALKTVPNSVFLKNAKVSTKGKKVTVLADVWSLAKKRSDKNPELSLDKYKKNNKGQSSNNIKFKLKEGMKVAWKHPKAGDGRGVISKISGNMASIDKVVGSDGKPGKPVRLPIAVLKPVK